MMQTVQFVLKMEYRGLGQSALHLSLIARGKKERRTQTCTDVMLGIRPKALPHHFINKTHSTLPYITPRELRL